MSFKELIINLEDFELAFLNKYRYNEFLENTRQLIQKEIKERKLDNYQLNSLIEAKLKEPLKKDKNEVKCTRCKS